MASGLDSLVTASQAQPWRLLDLAASATAGGQGRGEVLEGGRRVEGVDERDVVADEGEDQHAAAGVGDQAGETAGAPEGAGLGPHPAAAGRALEAVLEGAVVRRDREAGARNSKARNRRQ